MSTKEPVLAVPKPWWKSKTLWFNILVAALLAVEMNLPNLQDFIEPEQYAYLLGAVNLINVVLRAVTKAPVTLR